MRIRQTLHEADRRWLLDRVDIPELLDQGDHAPDQLRGTFRDMERVNRFLGGQAITIRGVQRLTGHLVPGANLVILDIGTGHADIPRAIGTWLSTRQMHTSILGLDIDRQTLRTLEPGVVNGRMDPIVGDARCLPLEDQSVDIAMSSMTLHHLDDDEAVASLREMARVARLGIVVNDLLRTAHGFVVAWLLGRLATRNPLTRSDAHRSILRARTRAEMEALAIRAGLQTPVFDSVLGYRTSMTVGVRPWE